MKRAEILEPGAAFTIFDGPIPEPPANGLVVKTKFAGICHSDVHIVDGKIPSSDGQFYRYPNRDVQFPSVLGHEFAGLVHSMGTNVNGDCHLKIGDRVAVFPWVACMETDCPSCSSDQQHRCTRKGTALGIDLHGGYSSHVVVPLTKFAVRVPETIGLDVACMLPCSGVTTYHAVLTAKDAIDWATNTKGAASLLVVGTGGLGLWCIQIARAVLPKTTKIVCADIKNDMFSTARAAGSDDGVWWDSSDEDVILELTRRAGLDGGFDAVIDLVNSTSTSTRVFKTLHPLGIQVCVGLYGGSLSVSLPNLVLESKTVKGVVVGGLQQFRDLLELVARLKLKPPPIQYYQLEDVADGHRRLREGTMNGRGIIKYDK